MDIALHNFRFLEKVVGGDAPVLKIHNNPQNVGVAVSIYQHKRRRHIIRSQQFILGYAHTDGVQNVIVFGFIPSEKYLDMLRRQVIDQIPPVIISGCTAVAPPSIRGRQPGLDPTAQGLHHKCFSGDKLGVAFLECLFFNEDKQVIGPDLVFTGPLPDHRQNDEPLYICVFRAISRPFPSFDGTGRFLLSIFQLIVDSAAAAALKWSKRCVAFIDGCLGTAGHIIKKCTGIIH